jgi:mono/diheme cytochrome c family protein
MRLHATVYRLLIVLIVTVSLIDSLSRNLKAQDDREGVAFFEQRIRPVLVKHCYSCHSAQADKLRGSLLLDSRAGWKKGGDSGQAAIVPGEPNESPMIQMVRHQLPGQEMPPNQEKLPENVVADLVAWVSMGAPDPRNEEHTVPKRADKSWWSLQPLPQSFAYSNIDDFVVAKQKELGLSRNAMADPRTIIRRISYDLVGLPPSPDEVASFTAEFEVNAALSVEHLVDRLLASPRYGERWGRHWLDVVRFGESNGFERNFMIDDLWPYRDYVIQSINADKPFDQFIVEHLAGDMVGKDDPSREVGSAFLVAGPYDDVGNQSIEAQRNIRAGTLDEIITTTSSAFLGITLHCARCHHHKFDPIPTQDYYRMRAAFEGIHHGRRVLASPQERTALEEAAKPLRKELAEKTKERDALEDAIYERARLSIAKEAAVRPKIDVHGTEETFEPMDARYVRFKITACTGDFQQTKGRRTRIENSGRLTEFQIWTDEHVPRNVALASHGSIAEGAKSQFAEDFPEAYGAQFCIDGQFGEQWFIGTPSELTITLPKPERIDRIVFINARGDRDIDESKVRGATPCEYEIQISLDGTHWQTVASNAGREPWSPGHALAVARRNVTVEDEEKTRLQSLDREIAGLQAQLQALPTLKQAWIGTHTQPSEPTHVHLGGDPMKLGEPISPSSPSILEHVMPGYELKPDASEGERRLALAQWITDNRNPLTARVMANRIWQYHFGNGIVDTPSDFGFLGSRPTHPELLDFLANRLIAHQWRWKPLHREIILSQTYLQSSQWRETEAGIDKDARYLWRFPPRRLSAEEVRDTMLSVSGVLRFEPMGGPGFRLYRVVQNNVSTYFPLDQHGPETYRRSVYHQTARASVVDFLSDFDLPDTAFTAPKRASTTSPGQALTMLNHRFTMDMAKAMNDRLEPANFIRDAFQLAFQRLPSSLELAASEQLVSEVGHESLCRALLNSNELIYVE